MAITAVSALVASYKLSTVGLKVVVPVVLPVVISISETTAKSEPSDAEPVVPSIETVTVS